MRINFSRKEILIMLLSIVTSLFAFSLTYAEENRTQAPLIIVRWETVMTIKAWEQFIDEWVIAYDFQQWFITQYVNKVWSVDSNTPWVYKITYNVRDADFNYAREMTRTVTVIWDIIEKTGTPTIKSHSVWELDWNIVKISFDVDQYTEAVIWYGVDGTYTKFSVAEKSFTYSSHVLPIKDIVEWKEYDYIIYVRNEEGISAYKKDSFIIGQKTDIIPLTSWFDSYSANGQCYCASNFNNGLGDYIVSTPAWDKTVKTICDKIWKWPWAEWNPIYNDIQCGNWPANKVWAEEVTCSGRVDIWTTGCSQKWPTWNLDTYYWANNGDDNVDKESFIVNQKTDIIPLPSWSDSYSANGQCYCTSNFNNGLGDYIVSTPAWDKTVKTICDKIWKWPWAEWNPIYNDIQCGNWPANKVWAEEVTCSGRVDIWTTGCSQKWPTWNLDTYYWANNGDNQIDDIIDNVDTDSDVDTDDDVKTTLDIVKWTDGASGKLLAVPGAVGWGKNAKWGRWGRVLIVNTLKDIINSNDNFLSLREALTVEKWPRTVVFEVGGVFDMTSKWVDIAGESAWYLTVACQTAPNPWVVIKTGRFHIAAASNIVMTHCIHRNSDTGNPSGWARDNGRWIGIGQWASEILIDHASISWASDENFQIYQWDYNPTKAIKNITLSNSIISEWDADSTHPQSTRPGILYHSMWPSCNANLKKNHHLVPNSISMTSNYIAHNATRNGAVYSCEAEVTNNILYNWWGIGTDLIAWGWPTTALIENNLYKAGPSSYNRNGWGSRCVSSDYACAQAINWPWTYSVDIDIENNYYIDLNKSVSSAELMKTHPNIASINKNIDFSWAAPKREKITELADKNSSHMKCLWASKPSRDIIDARVINEFYNGTWAVGIFENKRWSSHNSVIQRDYSMYKDASHSSNYDSDKDGMSDEWEKNNGLNPNDKNDNISDKDGDGYTNIEEFLADMAYCK